jgi:hypothetical protein
MLDFVLVDHSRKYLLQQRGLLQSSRAEYNLKYRWRVNRVGDHVQLYIYRVIDTSILPQNSVNSTFIWGPSGAGSGRSMSA